MSERYKQLCDKVDAFFARVESRHRADLRCDRGCYDCCDVRLSITGVEAAAVLAAWRQLTDERRAEVRATWRDGATACAALDRKGRCAVYEGRPLVCRSHGVPIRFSDPTRRGLPAPSSEGKPAEAIPPRVASRGSDLRDKRSLPVVEACFHNFTTAGPAAADADCILDQTTLSAMLLLIDREDAAAQQRPAQQRFELAELLRDA